MQPLRHATFGTLVAGALFLLLAACATAPGGPGPASEARAERLLRQGSLVEAARMYEELANNNPPPERDEFALSAARAWLDADRADDAQRALAIASVQLPDRQHFERELLAIEIAAARGQYRQAFQQATQLAEPPRREDASRLFYLRQQVALRAGEPAAAVQAGIARERAAADENGRTRARRDLLTDLRAAIDRGLRIDPAASRDALERGWLEIAQVASTAGRSPLSARSLVDRWRQRFPGHPAATIVDTEIIDPAARSGEPGGAQLSRISGPVALLLPMSNPRLGPSAATLVRDGFRTAAGQLPDSGLGDVRIYDTHAQPVGQALRGAVADGATFIVGPLTREEVQAAAEATASNVPVLLLNTLPAGAGRNAWQFALAPEDEARQIARHLGGRGANVAVMAPAGEWGQRVAAAFSEELALSGGRVAAEGYYNVATDIEFTLRRVLGIDASRQRRERVQSAIGTAVVGEVRPEPHIDALFVAGFDPLAMRQIRPFQRQFNAANIPTYMTTEGLPADRTGLRDLEGVRLVEMPWFVDTVGTAADVRLSTEHAWSSVGSVRDSRLFAFGYDAAMLAAQMRRGFVSWPLEGLTGRMTLAPDGRIERQLNWAQVRDGQIQPADPLTN
jgi:outer membrane PBP1 activator LpoA protein